MNRFRAAVLALCTAIAPFTSAAASVIRDWNAIAVTTIITNAGKPPAVATIDLVYVNVAMYDAVNAIDGRYSVFAVSPTTAPAGASEEAAAIAAAYNVLETFYPRQAAFLDQQYAASLAPIPDGDSKSRGVQIGQEVATLYLARRSTDGRNANITYTPETGPGAWQPTPPAFLAAQGPWIAQMTPFAINSSSQFRADPPPALDSATWIADYNETRSLGDINSVTRTPEQTEVGLFYTEHTGRQYDRILCDFAAAQNFSLADEGRFMAQMLVSIGDALISTWDSKFHYGRWRPVTVIRLTDDPHWTPLAVTPNHPEYPAAHGAFTGALAEGLRQFFGTKDVAITLSSTVTGTTRTFSNTDDLVKEIVVARIYGGMHFRTSVIEGKVQGTKAAKWVANHCFRPVDQQNAPITGRARTAAVSNLKFAPNHVVIHVDDDAAAGGNGSGEAPYNNIAAALAAANATTSSVTIQVAPGDYVITQTLLIGRSMELRGSSELIEDGAGLPTGDVAPGTETRIVAASSLGAQPVMLVGRSDAAVLDGVNIRGFVFEGTTSGIEMLLTRVQDYVVSANVFRAPAIFALQSVASSGSVKGNHFSGVGTGAIFNGGYPASPSSVVCTGNRAVRNSIGGVLLGGASINIPEPGDELDAVVRGNDLSANTGHPVQSFGLRVFILRRDLGAPGDTQSSARVHALVQDNRISGNRVGIVIDAGFPYRRVGTVCDTRVYSGAVDLTFVANTVTGSLLTPALVTSTRNVAALNQALLPQWQYLHGATFVISDRDGALADAWIDHPELDPFLGPCSGDAVHESLGNVLIYNGAVVPNGRNF